MIKRKWYQELVTVQALVSLLLSTIAGGMAGYYADYLKSIRGVYLDQASKFAFGGDDLSAASRSFLVGLGQNQKEEAASRDALISQVAKQLSIVRQLKSVWTDESVRILLSGYEQRLVKLDQSLQTSKNAADLGPMAHEIDQVSTARKAVASRLLLLSGINEGG